MTEPTYLLTEADKDYFIKCIKTLCTGSHSDVTKTAQTLQGMLQSLPMVSGEPFAYHLQERDNVDFIYAHEYSNHEDRMHERGGKVTRLYTSPQALTQQIGMEAADFAGWLVEHVEQEIIYEERLLGWLGKWLKHRSEAK